MTRLSDLGEREVREYLRISDAMEEANRRGLEEEDGSKPLRQVAASTRLVGGIRFERCGGGRRVVRRQRRAE